MPVTASWHTSLSVPATDPFAAPERIEAVGVPIRLNAGGREAELRRELLDTVEREVRLGDQGIGCDIKGTAGTSCFACPLHDETDALCTLGRTQERLVTELRVAHLGGRRK